jgi:hypothetical protein
MKYRVSLAWLASVWLAAIPPSAQAAGGCNECKDLPRLYRELLEQQFLRDKFNSWVKQAYYPASVKNMQDQAANALTTAMQHGAAGSGSASGGNATPSFGTDLNSKQCGLVQYVSDGNGGLKEKPVTPDDVKKKMCAPLADFVLAHEGHHQASCRTNYGAGKASEFARPEFVAQDEVAAYQAGIAVLRDHVAKLAKSCGWIGSSNERKPDGTFTVPTPSQIQELSANSVKAAGSLKNATRKGARR